METSVALKNFMINGKNEYLKNGFVGNDDSKLVYVNLLNHESCDGSGRARKNPPMEIVFISMKQLVKKISKSRSWVYAAMDEKNPTYDKFFPKPVRIGRRSICFVLSEVEFWLQSRIDASRSIQ
ncbi:helix-turn-helix transcriptional regulator [Variovorax boronicumulans]|uniref:helix-turn-helix transcriptional regulator n=1 Tax=Variovorax boronicumulans TaxID=436515 RepID=UPI001112EBA5|nr:AlpA family phage regulatory protein [Variovorax boronicumulans]